MDEEGRLFAGTTADPRRQGDETSHIAAELVRMAARLREGARRGQVPSRLADLALDTSSKFATALLQYQLDELGIDYIERRNGIVDAVTLEDARRVAGRVWGQGLLSVSVGRAPQASAQPAK